MSNLLSLSYIYQAVSSDREKKGSYIFLVAKPVIWFCAAMFNPFDAFSEHWIYVTDLTRIFPRFFSRAVC